MKDQFEVYDSDSEGIEEKEERKTHLFANSDAPQYS
jgi:hypothetical protein